ncbi:hypothetical protein [uncultured Brevundimonas sp.]|uniref:hypothetical protein n=1 Tax=uncultured Brevundimonas sp. TaxID=213418 RepID=UPI0025CE74DE|nr:hypothetical protein [uncultured Brevundimonas sp.]
MAHLAPLEAAVMEAMVWQMGDSVPDLAGQVAASSPGLRRNTGAGLYSQFLVDANRRATNPDATGLFGTVHAVVRGLADPVGFQIELRQGRLTALHGWSYGRDTRAIDFSSVPVEEVFTVDEHGRSVPYRPARQTEAAPAVPRAKPGVPTGVLQRLQQEPPPESHAKTFGVPLGSQPAAAPTLEPISPVGLTFVGLYLATALVGLILVFALRLPIVMVLVGVVWVLRAAHGKKGRAQLADFAARLDRQGVFQSFRPR